MNDPKCRKCGKTWPNGTHEATRDFVFHDICIGCNRNTYFLFGEQAVREFEEDDTKKPESSFGIYCFNPETSTPFELLNAYDGWLGWTEITKKKYRELEKEEDGDDGIVKCGKCGTEMRRCEAILNDKYLYLCNPAYCQDNTIKM